MINQGTYENLSYDLEIAAEQAVYDIGMALVALNKALIRDHNNVSKARAIFQLKVNRIAKEFKKAADKFSNNSMSDAYILGIRSSDAELRAAGKKGLATNKIVRGSSLIRNPPMAPIPEIPGQILLKFKGFESHSQFFGVFRSAAYYSLEDKPFQIMRKADDIFRKIAVQVGEQSFKEGDIITRRQISQKLLDGYAKAGLQSITYKNGARHSLDTYCEMLGRTMTGRCAVQASLNRFVERGYSLGIISAHFRSCDLCSPYEGTIVSLDGKDNRYPTIWDAETQGLFHANCYSDDTEVYTSNGWKLFKDVENKDKIFSLNPNSHIPEWVDYVKKFEYNPGNEMISFKSNSFDLLVTKNHNMYIGVNSHTGKKKQIIKWKIETAENCLTKNFKQLRCVNWEGLDLEYNTFGYTKKELSFLLGIFMAEGHTEKDNNRIVITQYKKACIEKIEKILKPMGFYFSGNRFIKDNRELANYLKTFGKQPERYIPEFILNEKPGIIKEFLTAFLIGDGSIRKNKSKLKDIESISKTYFTTSTKLAEQIGECILKVGKYPSFTLQKTKGKLQKHWNGDYSCNYDIWVIRENNSKMSYHNISKANSHRGIQSKIIDYNGMVYCLELEKNHIMLVRRNGKISWCGNCKHDVAAFFEEYPEQVSAPLDPAEERLVNENGYSGAQKIDYKAQEKQRYIERQIRMYKRREAVGLDELSKQKARNKIKEWQGVQRQHLNNNEFLRRKYEREQIKKAH